MEKLSCDSRVKCRTASSSPTSGSCGGVARRSAAGRSASAAGSASCGHWSLAPRPAREYSKINCSRCGMGWSLARVRSSGGTRRLHRLGELRTVTLDVGRGLGLGRAHQQRVAELGEVSREVRSEEHTSELQSHSDLVCRLLLEKKKKKKKKTRYRMREND